MQRGTLPVAAVVLLAVVVALFLYPYLARRQIEERCSVPTADELHSDAAVAKPVVLDEYFGKFRNTAGERQRCFGAGRRERTLVVPSAVVEATAGPVLAWDASLVGSKLSLSLVPAAGRRDVWVVVGIAPGE